MNRETQSIALGFAGAVLVRLSLSTEYLRFVRAWMRWPILACGLLLIVLALQPILQQWRTTGRRRPAGHDDHDHDHGGHVHGRTWTTWMLFVPGLIVFLVAPPPLGAYLAERGASSAVTVPAGTTFPPLAEGDPVDVALDEFQWRAVTDGGASVKDREVRLTGFVSTDDAGHWFVTVISIRCCAADAVINRVEVDGLEAPPRDQWVAVTGTLGPSSRSEVTLAGTSLERVPEPEETYR
ncbi:MAG: TIGR03943 family protein [Nocardioides sp.]|uniref:TIGR03943 family putative permease subunit n=1 Tax=Nocardioides sp. TaxID=35761 RepID=UPI0039E55D8F